MDQDNIKEIFSQIFQHLRVLNSAARSANLRRESIHTPTNKMLLTQAGLLEEQSKKNGFGVPK